MTVRRNLYPEAAVQYLVWALEEIEKSGHQKAAQHARLALKELRDSEAQQPINSLADSSP
jgi:hypothetical protein